jgi:hypothetical protein
MTRTGLQVITDALKLLGVVAGHEVPTSAEQQDAFARLTELIDSWGTHAQTLYVPHRALLPTVAAQQTYTVGDGGDLDVTPAPVTIDAVSYLTTASPPVEVYLEVTSDQAYVGQPVKALTGATPYAVSYTRGAPLGELWVWPVPTATTTLVLYWREPVAQFPDLVTPVDLLPGYAKALRCNLALELAPEFGRPLDPLIVQLARESLADVKRANLPYVEVAIDEALVGDGGGYSILTDS